MCGHHGFVQGRWSYDADIHIAWSEASSIPMVCTGTSARKQWRLSAVQWEGSAPDHAAANVDISENAAPLKVCASTRAVSIPHNPAV